MSQSVTFYPIDSNDFSAIKSNPSNLEILKDREDYVAFPGTHEGLQFVLSKGLDEQMAGLVNEIFYPSTYIGEVSQYVFPNSEEEHAFIDVTDSGNYNDFDGKSISYLDQEKVKQIASFLNTVSREQFMSQFSQRN